MKGVSSESDGRTIFLVDGTYELFRNYYGAPPRKSTDGKEAGAIVGLLRSLIKLIRSRNVQYIACAFDHVIESFRNELFPGYKTSEGVDEELLAQFPGAEEAVRALGVVVWPMVEFEADDAIATGSCLWESDSRVDRIILCSPDKDLCQCVRGQKVVCWNRRTDTILDEVGVVEKYGIPPRLIPDWLALVGDSADGIPGLAGWGPKTASQVLSRYGGIERVPLEGDRWDISVRGAPRLASRLAAEFDQVLLYRNLATLRTDVDLSETLEDLRWEVDSVSRFRKFCQWLGDLSLVESLEAVTNQAQ